MASPINAIYRVSITTLTKYPLFDTTWNDRAVGYALLLAAGVVVVCVGENTHNTENGEAIYRNSHFYYDPFHFPSH